jgi:hypothetical protein
MDDEVKATDFRSSFIVRVQRSSFYSLPPKETTQMRPHRAGLALAALVGAASAACMDARVKVPVRLSAVGDDLAVKPVPNLRLAVRKAPKEVAAVENLPLPVKCEGEQVSSETSSTEGTVTFELLPGDYQLCSDEQQFAGGRLRWRVPFRVERGGWEVTRPAAKVIQLLDEKGAERPYTGRVWEYDLKAPRPDTLELDRANAEFTPPQSQPACGRADPGSGDAAGRAFARSDARRHAVARPRPQKIIARRAPGSEKFASGRESAW